MIYDWSGKITRRLRLMNVFVTALIAVSLTSGVMTLPPSVSFRTRISAGP